jgi:hypothetical protein
MEDGNVKIKNGEISNEAKIQLNEKPVWNIDWESALEKATLILVITKLKN